MGLRSRTWSFERRIGRKISVLYFIVFVLMISIFLLPYLGPDINTEVYQCSEPHRLTDDGYIPIPPLWDTMDLVMERNQSSSGFNYSFLHVRKETKSGSNRCNSRFLDKGDNTSVNGQEIVIREDYVLIEGERLEVNDSLSYPTGWAWDRGKINIFDIQRKTITWKLQRAQGFRSVHWDRDLKIDGPEMMFLSGNFKQKAYPNPLTLGPFLFVFYRLVARFWYWLKHLFV